MKKSIILGLLLAITVRAEDRVIFWANNDPAEEVTSYRVWQWKGNNSILLTSAVTNRTTLINFKGKNTLTITAINAGGESAHSTNFVFIAKPKQVDGIGSIPP